MFDASPGLLRPWCRPVVLLRALGLTGLTVASAGRSIRTSG